MFRGLFSKSFVLFLVILSLIETRGARAFDSNVHCAAAVKAIQGRLETNTFIVQRMLRDYEKEFGPGFSYALRILKRYKGKHWVDGGAGSALPMIETLHDTGNLRMTAIGYKIPVVDRHLVRSSEKSPLFRYLEGRYLEKIPASEIGSASLVTDLFGPMSYSADLSKVLHTYMEVLETGGQFYFMDPHGFTKIRDKEKLYYSVKEWLETIPGLKVEPVGRHGVKVTKLEADIKIPQLSLRFIEDAGPPERVFSIASTP